MGEETNISWTERTFNPVKGCTKVSEGCKNCYAESDTKRYGLKVWGPQAPRIRTTADYWKQPLKWNAEAQATGKHDLVFCASWADVGEDHPDWVQPRLDLARLIEQTPRLRWQLLTKRPENLVRLFRDAGWTGHWPDNVWAGCTVESQEMAFRRIPHLLKVPAWVRFLSVEPMLECIDLDPLGCPDCGPSEDPRALWYDEIYGAHRCLECAASADGVIAEAGHGLWLAVPGSNGGIHWVICGGESGPKARPFELDWARKLRDQCKEAGTAFFMKQVGSLPMGRTPQDGPCWVCRHRGDRIIDHSHLESRLRFEHPKGGDPAEWPEDLRVQEFPEGHGD